ncbi:FAD/NAD(P)-binding protein [Sphingomonas jatrophae]|uniref:Uncharacterized NAD(P)/FAD-binding protein YdhS n=1 Tax=Sphingomonas jatrophae TaxID=1166337 RepID=A0A1I6J9U5_9SPHN|nr:FAD/NAD(P)-binding protein [Sphingomonas jatrophae]SFR75765.1 Uncharacterized NAD(P)/FAD-binding protein YdhS [Sphingomonas jatrophae]
MSEDRPTARVIPFPSRSEPPPKIDHIAIVGAGFSGTLQAINLLRHDGPRVTLIERRGAFGRGVAYSTPNPAHLLNVRAANMSALPDVPDHFVRWLAARGHGTTGGFATRRDYGDYLAELLRTTQEKAPGRLTLLHDSATDVSLRPDRVDLGMDSGATLTADAAVLALGNLPPHHPPGVDGAALPADLYTADPWSDDLTAGLRVDDTVLILGTGLTMVDAVLTLDSAGFGGRIVALSRRGLMPRAHADSVPKPLATRPAGHGADLLATVRARADAIGWRAAVDELRPHTQGMWLAAPVEEQRRFLRHLRPWWDVHRHRLAPAVAERLQTLIDDGRLEIAGGRIAACAARDGGLDVDFVPRGGLTAARHLRVRRLINCTGPQGDVLRTREPLLRLLLASGQIRADPHRLGIDVTANAETIDVNGRANPRLLALGPMTRGAFWEIVAVPDLRRQTWSVARRLSNAHWVEGEGL